MSSLSIYTDGSAYYKDGTAGYGVVYVTNDEIRCKFNYLPLGTKSPQAELLAAIYALRSPLVNQYDAVTLISDSSYLVDGMNKWAKDWLERGLRWYGITPHDDTVPKLYELLRETVGDKPFGLENSNGELIANEVEWRQLWLCLLWRNSVTFQWAPGHSKEENSVHRRFNDIADFLAAQGRDMAYEVFGVPRLEKQRDRRIR